MGYSCPVCADPQADARHLANHLAFTAILGDEEHESWLDEHAPGWADDGERELAGRVAEHADQQEYPQLFEDTTGQGGRSAERDDDRSGKLFDEEGHAGHDHLGDEHGTHEHGHGTGSSGHEADGSTAHDTDIPHERADVPRDPETEAVLEEARELTREMLADDESEATDVTDEADDGATGNESGDGAAETDDDR